MPSRLTRSGAAMAAVFLAAFVGALVSPAPSLAVDVYLSAADDGSDSGPAAIRGHTVLHVYFDGGAAAPNPGEECDPDATASDEVCQWAARLETSGNLAIVDVAWGGAALEDDEPTAPAMLRDGTGGDAVNGNFGPSKLATVAVAGSFGELWLKTPDVPDTPGAFGFVDKSGAISMVGMGTDRVLLASVPTPWLDVSTVECTFWARWRNSKAVSMRVESTLRPNNALISVRARPAGLPRRAVWILSAMGSPIRSPKM